MSESNSKDPEKEDQSPEASEPSAAEDSGETAATTGETEEAARDLEVEDAQIVEDAPANAEGADAAEAELTAEGHESTEPAQDPEANDASESTPPQEPQDDPEADQQGSGFAAAALKFLILALVIFAAALWIIPRTVDMPDRFAKHLMPGREAMEQRLVAMEEQIGGGVGATVETVAALEEQVKTLTQRLEEAEAQAVSAQEAAAASAAAAEAASVSEEVISEAGNAAKTAESAAETATTAATEAGKVASTALRDTASLARQVAAFETRIAAMSDELGALGEALANAPTTTSEGAATGTASPELAAAFNALKARVDGMAEQLETSAYVTEEDAARFATQDDLRSARTAMTANMSTAIQGMPDPETLVSITDLDAVKTDLGAQLTELTDRVGAAETAAADAQEASTTAVSQVEGAIRDASVKSAVAVLTSQINSGVPYAGALTELASLTGKAAPDALLASAETGLLTERDLLQNFAGPAQDAVAAEIRSDSGDGVFGSASARIEAILEGRPKTEQEGDDTVAIISRIEARLKEGDLAAALAEVDTLPEVAQTAMGAWVEQLRSRVGADEAAGEYISGLTGSQG
jgi:hypothetical protein